LDQTFIALTPLFVSAGGFEALPVKLARE